MENVMWGMSVRFLTILLILGNGVFTTHSELASPGTKGVVQHSVIHKRSMPIESPPEDAIKNCTESPAAKSAREQDMNNSNSTTVHKEEGKNSCTEAVMTSANTPKTTTLNAAESNLKANDKNNTSSTMKDATRNATSLDTTTEKISVSTNNPVDSKGANSSDSVVGAPQENTRIISEELHIKSLDAGNSTATMEQVDMLHSHVSPHDDDDVPAAPNKNSDNTADVTNSSKNPQGINSTDSPLPPEEFPKDDTVKSIETADPELRAKLNHTFYDVKTTNERNTTKDAKQKQESTSTKSVSGEQVLKTNAKSLQVGQQEDESKVTKSLDEKTKKNMSSGIIALLTTISFAVVVVIAYVGMIMWRRYLERKYGRRELLVNELEFDTNDLRHFEL